MNNTHTYVKQLLLHARMLLLFGGFARWVTGPNTPLIHARTYVHTTYHTPSTINKLQSSLFHEHHNVSLSCWGLFSPPSPEECHLDVYEFPCGVGEESSDHCVQNYACSELLWCCCRALLLWGCCWCYCCIVVVVLWCIVLLV